MNLSKVKLYTRDGDFVTEVAGPPFETPPAEVIFWGTRIFARNVEGEYREALPWYAIEHKEA